MAQDNPPAKDARDCRVAFVDNDALVLGLLSSLLGKRQGIGVEWTAKSGEEALESYHRCVASINCMPDVIVTDISMKGMSGFELAAAIRVEDSRTPILGMTSYAAGLYEHRAMDSGMQGIVEKEQVDRLLQAIRLVYQGVSLTGSDGQRFDLPAQAHERLAAQGKPAMLMLSDNERDVMDLCVQGLSTRQIAQILNTTTSTVKTYVSRASRKLGVKSKREAVAEWGRMTGF